MVAIYSLKIKTVGNACIIRYDRGEGTISQIIEANYSGLSASEVEQVKEYIRETRPDCVIDAPAESEGSA